LSTKLKDKQEKIEQVIAKLLEESKKGTPVVVEGKKDAQTLQTLGVEGPVFMVKTGGKSFLDAVAEIEQSGARKVMLLLDFDRRGREGTSRLIGEFERLRIKSNIRFWRDLKALTGKDIQCIESLPSYLETLKNKVSA
jgi:5S rRNA maturation endonuclease (ribonuclease M5)